MDVLPRDIVDIVYRLLFDYNYGRLIRQYTTIWLNIVTWSDTLQCFVEIRGVSKIAVANWRTLKGRYSYAPIFGLNGRKRVGKSLPQNYAYTSGINIE